MRMRTFSELPKNTICGIHEMKGVKGYMVEKKIKKEDHLSSSEDDSILWSIYDTFVDIQVMD